jgi:hypothetical protein
VCDPSSQFVAIYNEHEQLRDYLTISFSDEPLPSYGKAVQNFNNGGNERMPRQNTLDEETKFCPLNGTTSYIYLPVSHGMFAYR